MTLVDGPGIAEPDLFLQLGQADGHPDGVVLDSEDCLWVALWDGWAVRRYAPDGTLLLQVDLPCARVTKIAFGGPDLRTAYVTTARTGLDAAQLAAATNGGRAVCLRRARTRQAIAALSLRGLRTPSGDCQIWLNVRRHPLRRRRFPHEIAARRSLAGQQPPARCDP